MDAVELIRIGRDCQRSGDVDGALLAYQQADEFGDAEGAILLGQLYSRRGDTALAEAAFLRGEQRGHVEAPMCLGNLLSDLGDVGGAEAAYRRAIAAGSTNAVFNLGLLLGDQARVPEALEYLGQAEAAGDSDAPAVIGRILEKSGNLVGAVRAYRRAGEDNAQATLELGHVLLNMGDVQGAERAFGRARDLGNERADAVLRVLFPQQANKTAAPPSNASDAPEVNWDAVIARVGALLAEINALPKGIAEQRNSLRRAWIADTQRLTEKQSRLTVLLGALSQWRSQYESLLSEVETWQRAFGAFTPIKVDVSHFSLPSDSPDEWLVRNDKVAGSWVVAESRAREFDAILLEARTAYDGIRNSLFFSGKSQKALLEALPRVAQWLLILERARDRASAELDQAEQARGDSGLARWEAARAAVAQQEATADAAIRNLPAMIQPWAHSQWTTWTPGDTIPGLRVGLVGSLVLRADQNSGAHAELGAGIRRPLAVPLHDNWLVLHDAGRRADAHGVIRSLMLRHLTSVMPGELRFCVFDPVGVGQSVGEFLNLAEYDPELLGGKVWSSPQDLDGRLSELAQHVELVIQKYLRTTYGSIDEFNDAAGEVAEPYRVLVLFDYPNGLTADSAARLRSIVENGPRCGVFTIIALDATVKPPYGVDPTAVTSAMRLLNLGVNFTDNVQGNAMEYAFQPEVLDERSPVASRLIDLIGRESLARTDAAVTFEKTFELFNGVAARGLKMELSTAALRTRVGDPNTWWQSDSTRGLTAPIGQMGARDAAILTFDSGDHAGALLVGRPGSGKTTLLHAYIGGLTTLYAPEELELYLIDFKEGVEFKAYAEEGLPHAKVVAVESDREFGLSVMESLRSEIVRRGELLRGTGGRHAGMQAMREATGERLPRVLLVFDEFQVLFARNDKLGLAAADLLESIIRQGRGFGIHVLLGSQSLAGMDALGGHVHQLLPVRILLPASEIDGRRVLGEGNGAGDYLTTAGEGILNSAGGAVQANQPFKGALLPETDRIERIKIMRAKADRAGFTRRPLVFEGNAMAPLDALDPRQFREELAASGTAPVRLRTGRAMSVGDLGDIPLTREAGSNVMAVVRAGETGGVGILPASGPANGLLVAAVASAAMSPAEIDVIDFLSPDDGLDLALEPLLDAGRITLRRRRAFADLLERYTAEVSDRVGRDDTRAVTRLLFLFGVHRARELDSDTGSLDADTELADMLEQIMRDGPEVGVHVWLWADSLGGASRRLTPRMMREVGWRIAGKMSADDSDRLIGTSQAQELRESQLIVANEDHGVSTRMIGYAVPSQDWLKAICPQATSSKEK